MVKKILILTSGGKRKLIPFVVAAKKTGANITTASFNDVIFGSKRSGLYLKGGENLTDYQVIYFRLVGKSLENASLVADYAKKNGIQIVDKIYAYSQVFPITQSKASEMKALMEKGISIPETFFGSLAEIAKKSPKLFGFPFVVKSTSGKKGREVFSPRDKKDLKKLIESLKGEEKGGKRYFAQEFINAVKRIRVMIIGTKVVGAVSQLTKWRKRVSGYVPKEEDKKIDKYEPGKDIEKLALSATRAVGLDIAGVDILKDDKTGKFYVIEVNAAPSWKLVKKYSKVNIEYEIIKYLQGKIR